MGSVDTDPTDPGPGAGDEGEGEGPVVDPGGEPAGDGLDHGRDPLRFNNWMKRSATGALLSGIALGLQQALEPKRNLPAFVMEAPGEPEDPDAPITLHFDPDDPTKTVAVIRARPPTGDGQPSDGNGTGE